MNNLCTDIGYLSINKYGEQLCGDRVQIIKQSDDNTVMVLADGLGSGVKANILSTLTSKIISTMMANEMSIEDCVATIAATLPVCKKRGVAYSTFTIIRIVNNTYAQIIEYDNPKVILIRDGENYEYPRAERQIEGKTIYEAKIPLKLDDCFIAMSDGAIYAGVGQTLNYGWQRDNIVNYVVANYNYKLTAKTIASIVLDECNRLYANMPGDDTTVAAVQVRKRKACNVAIGPPRDPKDDNTMMSLFFSKEGRHIVCGGTTSNLASKYLDKPMITSIDYFDPEIPPTSAIEGVDLVTEGVITISRVVEYAKSYLDDNDKYKEWSTKDDGASKISRMLFEEATDINFFVGKAVNAAHQNPDLPITFNIKIQLIEELCKSLELMGKTVKVSYF